MKERPILFSAPMVRALLEGRKTQTRRVVEGAPAVAGHIETGVPSNCGAGCPHNGHDLFAMFFEGPTVESRGLASARCPYGAPGDRLWVRETWQLFDDSPLGDDAAVSPDRLGPAAPWKGCQGDRSITWRAAYRADGDLEHPTHGPANWRPSIHMPRWASRITLEVTGVRVERLQEMTFNDWRDDFCPSDVEKEKALATFVGAAYQREHAQKLWDSINGKRAPWSSNPWVWVVEFRRVEAAS